jgi:hypothetical protein
MPDLGLCQTTKQGVAFSYPLFNFEHQTCYWN